MKTTFKILDADFSEGLKLSYLGQQKYFNEDITIEYDECDALEVEIEQVSSLKCERENVKGASLGAKLLFLLKLIITILFASVAFSFLVIITAYDQEDDWEFAFPSPFTIKKTFKIKNPDGKTLGIKTKDTEFNKSFKHYTTPKLALDDDESLCIHDGIAFSKKMLKKQVLLVWLPIVILFGLCLGVFEAAAISYLVRDLGAATIDWKMVSLEIAGALLISGFFIIMVAVVIRSYKKCERISKNQYNAEE